jgi:hypothetical protein
LRSRAAAGRADVYSLSPMGVTTFLLVVGIFVWIGAALLIDTWLDRRSHADHLSRGVPVRGTVADEAQEWLNNRV